MTIRRTGSRAGGSPASWRAATAGQDESIAYVEANLDLVAKALRDTADYYQLVEQSNADLIHASGGEVAG